MGPDRNGDRALFPGLRHLRPDRYELDHAGYEPARAEVDRRLEHDAVLRGAEGKCARHQRPAGRPGDLLYRADAAIHREGIGADGRDECRGAPGDAEVVGVKDRRLARIKS